MKFYRIINSFYASTWNSKGGQTTEVFFYSYKNKLIVSFHDMQCRDKD